MEKSFTNAKDVEEINNSNRREAFQQNCNKRAAVWMGRAWRRQNVYEWHPSQDEILKSGKWSIGNRTKYFGIKP